VAIFVTGAVIVTSASINADGALANSLISKISTPGVSDTTVGIISAIEANSVGHAVSTLGTSALVVVAVGASSYALARSQVAIDLVSDFTTIERSTSAGYVVDGAVEALIVGLTILTKTSVSGKIAVIVGSARERIEAKVSGDIARRLSRRGSSI